MIPKSFNPDLDRHFLNKKLCERCFKVLILPTKTRLLVSLRNSSYSALKDKDYCPIEIIKGLTDKGQFQYLTKLMGPQEGTYLYATQSHLLR